MLNPPANDNSSLTPFSPSLSSGALPIDASFSSTSAIVTSEEYPDSTSGHQFDSRGQPTQPHGKETEAQCSEASSVSATGDFGVQRGRLARREGERRRRGPTEAPLAHSLPAGREASLGPKVSLSREDGWNDAGWDDVTEYRRTSSSPPLPALDASHDASRRSHDIVESRDVEENEKVPVPDTEGDVIGSVEEHARRGGMDPFDTSVVADLAASDCVQTNGHDVYRIRADEQHSAASTSVVPVDDRVHEVGDSYVAVANPTYDPEQIFASASDRAEDEDASAVDTIESATHVVTNAAYRSEGDGNDTNAMVSQPSTAAEEITTVPQEDDDRERHSLMNGGGDASRSPVADEVHPSKLVYSDANEETVECPLPPSTSMQPNERFPTMDGIEEAGPTRMDTERHEDAGGRESHGKVNNKNALESHLNENQNPDHKHLSSEELSNEATRSGEMVSKDRYTRLLRLVENLRRKIDRLQTENVQLEEMLAAADAAQKGGSGEIMRLEHALKEERENRAKERQEFDHVSSQKELELRSLNDRLSHLQHQNEELTTRAEAMHAQVVATQAQHDATEGELVTALRHEAERVESRLEAEKTAHDETRRAAAERESTLEASVEEAVAALTAMQKLVDERTARLEATETRQAELEKEIATLRRSTTPVGGRDKAAADAASKSDRDGSELKELQQTLEDFQQREERARTAMLDAEERCAELKTECDSLRQHLREMETQCEDADAIRHLLQEANDTLYLKQSQLEKMQAERAALSLQVESLRAEVASGGGSVFDRFARSPSSLGGRSTSSNGATASNTRSETLKRRSTAVDRLFGGDPDLVRPPGEDNDGIFGLGDTVVPMRSIGGAYAKLANAPGRLGGAVQRSGDLLDSLASRVVWVLRRHPLARLMVFAYVIAMHLFIYVVLHRVQRTVLLHGNDATVGSYHSGDSTGANLRSSLNSS